LDPVLIALLSVHLLLALGWLGGELMTAFVIGPGLQQMSLQSKREFFVKVTPRAVRYVKWMIVGTGVTGFLLAFVTPSKLAASGVAVSAGIVLALIAAAIEVVVTDALQKSGQQTPSQEMATHEKRARWGSLADTGLLVAVLVLMVITGL
jgi:uncharacterized membrane protein